MSEAVQRRTWWKAALGAVIAIELLGGLSGWISNSGYGNPWFDALAKPSFMPPGWLFGVVWPILYALLGIALGIILAESSSAGRRLGLILFFVQLALNFSWSPIFFAAHAITLAKYIIFVMIVAAVAAAAQFFRLRKIAGVLMIPYLGWLVFAATLNSSIDALNSSSLGQ